MIVWSAILIALGGAVTVGATLWLVFGLNPSKARYNTAALRNRGLENMLVEQRRILFALTVGSAIQFASHALWAALADRR